MIKFYRGGIDYVGTRLHAGIRALNYCARTIIVGVDNRAKEISRDTGLCVVDRSLIRERLEDMIDSDFETIIRIPIEEIDKWRNQFRKK